MSRYVDPHKASKSWRPKSGSMSPGLKRAREPYRIPNAITGILLGAFAIGVYTYSIRAVRQDDFGDLDEEVLAGMTEEQRAAHKEALAAKRQQDMEERKHATVLSVGEEKEVMERAARAVAREINNAGQLGAVGGVVSDETSSLRASEGSPVLSQVRAAQSRPKGVLVRLLENRAPFLVDASGRVLVWGAPSVDNIGTVSSRR